MKRRSLAILCVLVLLAMLLTACGGSGGGDYGESTFAASNGESPSADFGGMEYDWAASAPKEDSAETEEMGYGEGGGADALSSAYLKNAKMIYTGNLEMETTDFSACVSSLEALVERLGGYMEYAAVNNYGTGYRSGNYTVRIPSGQFNGFLRSAGEIGHITYQDQRGENISEAYYDTESRLATQRIKLERLQALLARAENMADIITIETSIAETEYEIEQLTGTLRHYDALVDFATVYVNLNEVTHLSSVEQTPPSYTTRLSTSFMDGLQNFADGMGDFTIFLAYNWTWLLVWVVLIVLGVLIFRHFSKREKKAWKLRFPKRSKGAESTESSKKPDRRDDGPQ